MQSAGARMAGGKEWKPWLEELSGMWDLEDGTVCAQKAVSLW